MRAQIVHDADKLATLYTALEYAKMYPDKQQALENFWEDPRYNNPKTEAGKTEYNKLLARRKIVYARNAQIRTIIDYVI